MEVDESSNATNIIIDGIKDFPASPHLKIYHLYSFTKKTQFQNEEGEGNS